MTTPTQEILSIDECIMYIRENFNLLYPTKPKAKKHTFGNIPADLHSLILGLAEERNLTIAQAIAALWDLYTEYETVFADQLKAQRQNRRR